MFANSFDLSLFIKVSKRFIFYAVAFFLLFIPSISSAQVVAQRLEQSIKDTLFGSASYFYEQSLSCTDLTGNIEQLTLSLNSVNSASAGVKVFFYRLDENLHNSPQIAMRTSGIAYTGGANQQADVTFTFPQPIDVDGDLCSGANAFKFRIMNENYPYSGPSYIQFYGGSNNPYTGGVASGSEVPSSADMYFIVNGVAEVNHPPVLAPIGNKSTDEGKILNFSLSAIDQDQAQKVNYSANGLPQGSVFDATTGIFSWTPAFSQAGTYQIELIATDNGNGSIPPEADSETIIITVGEATPILNRLEQLVKNTLFGTAAPFYEQTLSCGDLSGTIEQLTLSLNSSNSGNLGVKAFFYRTNENLNTSPLIAVRTSNVSFIQDQNQQSEVTFTFPQPIDVDGDVCNGASTFKFRVVIASYPFTGQNYIQFYGGSNNPYAGGVASGSTVSSDADMYFIVNSHALTNDSPELLPTGNKQIQEGQVFQFTISATDPDNSDILTYTASNLPQDATFDPNTRTFSWIPDYNDAGVYADVIFTVSDNGNPVGTDTESITITVTNTNRTPVLNPIGNQTVSEGATLTLTLSSTDEDNDTLTYSASNLPAGSSFNSNDGIFNWTPGFDEAGNYTDIEFTVSDNGTPMELAVELITITVGNINRAPVFTNPGPKEVLEDESLSFTVTASDPDSDSVTITGANMPSGASFDGTIFNWTPTLAQEGIYTISFTATDNGTPVESSLLEIVITVGDNPTPTEQTENLVDTVVTFNLPQNIENSYLANLQKVGQFIADGKIQSALNQLQAFINKVQTDYQQGKITLQVHNVLLEMAEALTEDLSV